MLLRLKAPAENASGRQGQQLVYFMWRTGQTARNWVNPSQPDTTDQIQIRAYLSAITKRWPTISSGDRSTWATYAAAHPITNRMGAVVRSTALGMYLRVNIWKQIKTSGVSFTDTAPTVAPPPPPTAVTAFAAGTPTDVDITVTHSIAVPTGYSLIVRAQPSVSTAANPAFEAIRLWAGVDDNSTPALPASGSPANASPTRFAFTVADEADVAVQIMDSYGQTSTPYKVKITVT